MSATTAWMEQVERFFADTGRLSSCLDNFRPRIGQQQMAQAVADTIAEMDGTLIVEAGTGTGKTLAYLVPAILSGKRVMISTASKNLQNQLMELDIPRLRQCLPQLGEVVLLKGRENYVCAQRLALAEQQGAWLPAYQLHQLAKIRTWLAAGGNGDRAQCDSVPEDAPVWRQVCAQAAFCQSADCKEEAGCLFPHLRERARKAQVVIVNHHLLAADLALRQQGRPGVLPECEVYVVDEAHHLPQILQQFMGIQLGMGTLAQWQSETLALVRQEAAEMTDLKQLLEALPERLAQFHGCLPSRPTLLREEMTEDMAACAQRLMRFLDRLLEVMKEAASRSTALEAAAQQLAQWCEALEQWWASEDGEQVRWLVWHERGFRFMSAPLQVSGTFSSLRQRIGGSWVFTSATLNAAEDFRFFRRQLGLETARTLKVDSPFDYARQGLIYHPQGLPHPRHPDYVRQCMRRAWPLLKASGGHALLLFSSYQAMHEAADLLKPHWPGRVLVQGEQSKPNLLRQFRSATSPLLLATASFWEGVDLPGDQLRLVVIDRIPFRPPDDPILQAQEKQLKERGLSAFALLQVPQAALALKQGVGRLIRREQDRGVLMLCDPRLTQMAYGRQIRDELPPFPWTESGREVCRFLQQMPLSEGHVH